MSTTSRQVSMLLITSMVAISCGGDGVDLADTTGTGLPESTVTVETIASDVTEDLTSETTSTPSLADTTTTTTAKSRPSCLQSDIVTEEGFTAADWPDDFCDYWPSIHDMFDPIPVNWSAPDGWVELDADAVSFRWHSTDDYALPPEGVDPRLRAFTFNTYSSEGHFFSGFVSEEMPIGGSISNLPDGVYTASLVEWDRSVPDRAVFQIGPIMDCVPGGVWGEYDDHEMPLCGGEPGERHEAIPTCGPLHDLCVEVEVTLDDSFTVVTSGYAKELNEDGFPTNAEWIGQGPDLVELLTALHDDYYDTFVVNGSLGPELIESQIVPDSPFRNIIQGVEDENDDRYGLAMWYDGQVFAWSRPEFPMITMYASGNWGDEWASPSLFPVTPWGLERFYDEDGPEICKWWELNYSRPEYKEGIFWTEFPCRIEEGIFSFNDKLPRAAGSFMKIHGRTAWVLDLPYANS